MPKIWNGYYLIPLAVSLVIGPAAIVIVTVRHNREKEEPVHQAFRRVGAGANKLLQLWYALGDFARDHKGRVPQASHWQDDLTGYWPESEPRLRADLVCCPASGEGPATGIAFNERFSGWPIAKLDRFDQTPVFHEVPAVGRNLVFDPKDYKDRRGSRFLDGHRDWLEVTAPGTLRGNPRWE